MVHWVCVNKISSWFQNFTASSHTIVYIVRRAFSFVNQYHAYNDPLRKEGPQLCGFINKHVFFSYDLDPCYLKKYKAIYRLFVSSFTYLIRKKNNIKIGHTKTEDQGLKMFYFLAYFSRMHTC